MCLPQYNSSCKQVACDRQKLCRVNRPLVKFRTLYFSGSCVIYTRFADDGPSSLETLKFFLYFVGIVSLQKTAVCTRIPTYVHRKIF